MTMNSTAALMTPLLRSKGSQEPSIRSPVTTGLSSCLKPLQELYLPESLSVSQLFPEVALVTPSIERRSSNASTSASSGYRRAASDEPKELLTLQLILLHHTSTERGSRARDLSLLSHV